MLRSKESTRARPMLPPGRPASLAATLALGTVLAALLMPTLAYGAEGEVPEYEVDCPEGASSASACRVGSETYEGYRTYSSTCLHCHGAGGLGSTFAPNLLRQMNAYVDYDDFVDAVMNGVRGQRGVMKGFADDPKVAGNVDNLYRYLRARADEALPNGRPEKMENGE